jgi:hypothetical protein
VVPSDPLNEPSYGYFKTKSDDSALQQFGDTAGKVSQIKGEMPAIIGEEGSIPNLSRDSSIPPENPLLCVHHLGFIKVIGGAATDSYGIMF